MGTLYVLENKINGKCYVGQTIRSLKERLYDHKSKKKSAIACAIKKYGINNFRQYQYVGIPIELLDYGEVELIRNLNCQVPYGYNIEGGGNKNKKVMQETKYKQSIAHIGISIKRTNEWKNKISDALKGHKVSMETRKKLSINNNIRGNKHWLGRHHTEETKNKLRLKNTGQKRNTEIRKKISENSANKIKIKCIETGEVFNSINKAALKYKILHIYEVCQNKRKTAGGYHWQYYN